MVTSGTRIFTDPEIGEVVLKKSIRARHISIRVHPTKGVSVTLPYIIPYAAAKLFFQTKRRWVLKTIWKQKKRREATETQSNLPAASEIEALRLQAKRELPPRLAELAAKYGFTYHRVTIKHNSSNWGSCSTRGNINLNLNIVRLPQILQDYILLHELCHLHHPNHGEEFHILLERLLSDHISELLRNAPTPATAAYVREASGSRSRFPITNTLSRGIKGYKLW
jgi:predicted metal-dependent hydrolase